MPKYLLALDPSVILAAARAEFDVFEAVLLTSTRPPASGVALWSSLGLGRVVDREPKLGVVAPRRVRSDAGVILPEGVIRPDAEYDEFMERWDATDDGRDGPAATEVGGASLSARVKMPQFGAQSKYRTLRVSIAHNHTVLTHRLIHHSCLCPGSRPQVPRRPSCRREYASGQGTAGCPRTRATEDGHGRPQLVSTWVRCSSHATLGVGTACWR